MVVGCVAVVNTFTRRALALGGIQITPATALMGGAVRIAFELTNTHAQQTFDRIHRNAVRWQPARAAQHAAARPDHRCAPAVASPEHVAFGSAFT